MEKHGIGRSNGGRLTIVHLAWSVTWPNNRFERSRAHLRGAKEGVDDCGKSASFGVGATPRRSTSSLGTTGGSMPSFQQIFPFIPLAVFALFAWRYFRRGSLVGALLGGKLTETIGEISLSSQGLSSRVLRVSLMAAPPGNRRKSRLR
jgi:hypothetical protein